MQAAVNESARVFEKYVKAYDLWNKFLNLDWNQFPWNERYTFLHFKFSNCEKIRLLNYL